MLNRRDLLVAGAVLGAGACTSSMVAAGSKAGKKVFPKGFLWGASVAGHQVEGNNTASDLWYLENLPETGFAEPSLDGVNHFLLWQQDLDLMKALGLNTFRFSLEWARIEPVEGKFSKAMLGHYRNGLEGCKARGLKAVVTFNHYTTPLWFSADGGWTNPKAVERFARFCRVAAEELGELMSYALTFNEPQILAMIRRMDIPDFIVKKRDAMLAAAERDLNVKRFSALNYSRYEDIPLLEKYTREGHLAGRDAIKSAQPKLPVGLSIAIFDDHEAGPDSMREQIREELYYPWFEITKGDEFIGLQNYERKVWTRTGALKAPADSKKNFMGSEVYAPSLAGAVQYAYEQTKLPIFVTEHGVGTDDDSIRQYLIPNALSHLHDVMSAENIPVIGYSHWSMLDNFEWSFGYKPKYGLVAVDRNTFKRTPKPSATVYGGIARRNAIPKDLLK